MLTIQSGKTHETEIEVKRSRFIGFTIRANTQEEAREAVNARRARFPDARHHCSAYTVSLEGTNPLWHSSDDGEPSGTAGMPMLQVLQHSGLENTVVVVTRYFGGVLLGTGGLVRAYSDSARLTLDEAPKSRLVTQNLYQVDIPIALAGRVEAEYRGLGYQIFEAEWGSSLSLTIIAANPKELNTRLAEITRSDISFQNVGTHTAEVPEEI